MADRRGDNVVIMTVTQSNLAPASSLHYFTISNHVVKTFCALPFRNKYKEYYAITYMLAYAIYTYIMS